MLVYPVVENDTGAVWLLYNPGNPRRKSQRDAISIKFTTADDAGPVIWYSAHRLDISLVAKNTREPMDTDEMTVRRAIRFYRSTKGHFPCKRAKTPLFELQEERNKLDRKGESAR